MKLKSNPKIALLGNPNCGKSSLFNHLTGLNQKVGNFPGVTVDKKTGKAKINDSITADVIDLPGIYSLYPRSVDEQIVFDYLSDTSSPDYPDLLLAIVDSSNLKRNLFLFSQLYDLGIPIILVLTMSDVAQTNGLSINSEVLKTALNVPVVLVNARTGKNTFRLKELIANPPVHPQNFSFPVDQLAPELIADIKKEISVPNSYLALQSAHQFEGIKRFSDDTKSQLRALVDKHNFNSRAMQVSETMHRYAAVDEIIAKVLSGFSKETLSDKLDKLLTHKVWGYLIFFGIMLVMFQAIFSWAAWPMDKIDEGFSLLSELIRTYMAPGPFTDLLVDGIVAGLGGILIFIPQIAILFGLIAILEESGYMARVMFIMDKFMRKFGMNGRSVVPLISGVACAVPAVMAARSIDNVKERLITIFVTPFMSCSARLPVYTILIALVIPDTLYFGLINLQGLVLMGLYLAGFLMAVATGIVMNWILNPSGPKSFFMLELPSYKSPRWTNVFYTIVEKVKSFTFEAGKVIMAISIILWVLSSYGPSAKIESGIAEVLEIAEAKNLPEQEVDNMLAASKLENSYAGHFGKFIEPVIRPLGFDWKIGIALFTSFAAREVFVGTMSTIYSIGDEAKASTIKSRMQRERNPETGGPMYTLPLGVSLLLFYAFAMQCMSTLAIVYRETKSIKWPLLQFVFMTGVAYLCSFVAYQLLS
jgi:ferrous iron transport protein B